MHLLWRGDRVDYHCPVSNRSFVLFVRKRNLDGTFILEDANGDVAYEHAWAEHIERSTRELEDSVRDFLFLNFNIYWKKSIPWHGNCLQIDSWRSCSSLRWCFFCTGVYFFWKYLITFWSKLVAPANIRCMSQPSEMTHLRMSRLKFMVPRAKKYNPLNIPLMSVTLPVRYLVAS